MALNEARGGIIFDEYVTDEQQCSKPFSSVNEYHLESKLELILSIPLIPIHCSGLFSRFDCLFDCVQANVLCR
jgi:hypothetical protein